MDGRKPEKRSGRVSEEYEDCNKFVNVAERVWVLVIRCVSAFSECLGILRYLYRNLVNTELILSRE